jgi:dUTP diphosphatase
MSENPIIQFTRLDPRATAPKPHSAHAAGLDLAACLPRDPINAEAVELAPGAIVKIPLGLAIAIPPGYEGQIRPRSGLATKFGVTVPNAPGTVDADYRGEMFVALINLGPEPYTIKHGHRIAQMVIAKVASPILVEVDQLDATDRGASGFGSTGL